MRRTARKTSNVSRLALLTFIGLGIMFAFYGCQMLQPKETPPNVDEQPLDRRIGLIKSLGGVKTSSQGTHLLQLDDGSTILLKSLQINLDDLQYSGKNVEVRGLITYTTDGKQIMEVENIDILQNETPASEQQVSWEDYASAGLNFSIKYRSDFKVDDTDSTKVSFSKEVQPEPVTQQTLQTEASTQSGPVSHDFIIEKTDLKKDELLTFLKLKDDSSAELLAKGFTKSKVGAMSMDSLKKTDGNKIIYYVVGDPVYQITLDSGSDQETLSDQNLFYEMLGTFRIMGADSSTGHEGDLLNNLDMGSQQPLKVTSGSTSESSASAGSNGSGLINFDAAASGVATIESIPATQQQLEGYAKLQSDVFNFALQYPKSWYYAGSAGSDTGVIRHYEFGSKPLDEQPGNVFMDVMSGTVPGGSQVTANGKTVTKTSSGSNTVLYVQGTGSRVYKITGPSAQESTLLQMAGSIE